MSYNHKTLATQVRFPVCEWWNAKGVAMLLKGLR